MTPLYVFKFFRYLGWFLDDLDSELQYGGRHSTQALEAFARGLRAGWRGTERRSAMYWFAEGLCDGIRGKSGVNPVLKVCHAHEGAYRAGVEAVAAVRRRRENARAKEQRRHQ